MDRLNSSGKAANPNAWQTKDGRPRVSHQLRRVIVGAGADLFMAMPVHNVDIFGERRGDQKVLRSQRIGEAFAPHHQAP